MNISHTDLRDVAVLVVQLGNIVRALERRALGELNYGENDLVRMASSAKGRLCERHPDILQFIEENQMS